MFGRRALLVVVLAVVASLSCKRTDGGGAKPKIAVVPKGTTHEFWKAVHAGAMKAAQEENIEVVWKGPLREDDLKSQIDIVESFVAQGVKGIVLAPLNDKALHAAVRDAKNAGIPTVVFDSDLEGTDHVSFVATDNVAAGRLAADAMVKLLGGRGNVVVLRYQEGSASTSNREKGFLDGIAAHPEIKVVSSNQYGGATTETAFAMSENVLAAHKAAQGGVDGVFCPNESTTFGMLRAIRTAGLAGKIRFVGFDSSDKLVSAVTREHDLDALVLQDPMTMGYLAVKTMAAHLAGKPVATRVDTGAALFTKDNAETPEMKALVAPDVKRWLKEE